MSGQRATSARYNSTPSSLYVVPDPSPLSPLPSVHTGAGEAEVEQLRRLFAAGQIEPVRVDFPPVPADLSPVARAVLADFALIRGLRLWAGDVRPVPYGRMWVAARLETPASTVRRALRELEAAGLIEFAEELPGRGGRRGTRCYLPGRAER